MFANYILKPLHVAALAVAGVLCGCSTPEVVASPEVMIGATGGPFDEAVKAAYAGNLSYIKQCVESDPRYVESYDAQGRTLLHYAAEGGHVEVVKYLLENGAYASLDDNDGYYPVDAATQGTGSKAVIDLLNEAFQRESGR